MNKKMLLLAVGASLFCGFGAVANASPAYKKCLSCHTFEEGGKNRMGPNLFGLLGKKAGTAKGYKYGSFLKNSDFVWTERLLKKWDYDAKAVAKAGGGKTKMPSLHIKGKKEAEIIAFFKKHSNVPVDPPVSEEVKNKGLVEKNPCSMNGNAKETKVKVDYKKTPCGKKPNFK